MRLLFLILVFLLSWTRASAVPSYDSDYTMNGITADSGATITSFTFGTSAGGAYVLFFEIDSEHNFWNSSMGTITYNGTTMTQIGSITSYTGAGKTGYKGIWYVANPISGGPITLSGGSTPLGDAGASSWLSRFWTYSNASSTTPIGTTSVGKTNSVSGTSNTPITISFNFTPSSSTSTILQVMPEIGSTTALSYGATNGIVERALTMQSTGGTAVGIAFSDYSPGSTSLYSLDQFLNPNFNNITAYGWGIEVLSGTTAGSTTANTLMLMGAGQ